MKQCFLVLENEAPLLWPTYSNLFVSYLFPLQLLIKLDLFKKKNGRIFIRNIKYLVGFTK